MVVITQPTFCSSSLFGMGIERRAKGFRARVKKGTRTFNSPVRDTKEEAAADERQYQEAAAESAEKMETLHEELHRPPDLLDQRGVAKVVKNGRQLDHTEVANQQRRPMRSNSWKLAACRLMLLPL